MQKTIFFRRVSRKLKSIIKNTTAYARDIFFSTYTIHPDSQLKQYIFSIKRSEIDKIKQQILNLSNLYRNHYFDLLGSGWVQVVRGMNCNGLEGNVYQLTTKQSNLKINFANQRYSKLVEQCISKKYIAIDWQRDFKSGFRWSEKTWYYHIKLGHKPGVDVKVPWELARMQHLPQLAFAFLVSDTKKAQQYQQEFCNQILDFIAHNPPRYGVNWRCTMDVGIRIANWLLAYDLFIAADANFNHEFKRIFLSSVYDHGLHIVKNLEWYGEHIPRSNHYLANIVGLLFVAAYLPASNEVTKWYTFSTQELIKEVELQFNPDGSNVEGSTSYHRLSAEMVIYATALVLRISSSAVFPGWYFERLERMAEFTISVTKPNKIIAQVGDNDSGRFVKIYQSFAKLTVKDAKQQYKNLITYHAMTDDVDYWDENVLDHRHLVAAINGLFDRPDFELFSITAKVETILIKHLSGNKKIPSYHLSKSNKKIVMIKPAENIVEKMILQEYSFESQNGIHHLQHVYFEDFGLCVYHSKDFYLHVRVGGKPYGSCGHWHCDQLAVELYMDDKAIFSDSGSYLYTAMPSIRNYYRQCSFHATPALVEESCIHVNTNNLFGMKTLLRAEITFMNENRLVAKICLNSTVIFREISISERTVRIADYTEKAHNANVQLKRMDHVYTDKGFSSGYGKQLHPQL